MILLKPLAGGMLKLEEYSRLTLSVSLLFILKPVLVSCKPVDLDPLQSVSPSPTTVLVEVTQSGEIAALTSYSCTILNAYILI